MALFTPWKLSSQKLGFFLVTFGFIWGMMLLHFTIQQRTQPESSSMLREQILDLSKRYIKALAEENRNVVDGPYAGVMTAYAPSFLISALSFAGFSGAASESALWSRCPSSALDWGAGKHGHGREGSALGTSTDVNDLWQFRYLKKTLAVLLDNILQRIGKLESKVDNLVINGTGTNLTNSTTAVPSLVALEKINVADIINGAQEKCVLPPMDGYPHCEGKIKWMKDMWRSDPCYAEYGVDGSTCSFFIYLSEVENWCPHLPWRAKNPYEEADRNSLAEIRTDFNILYSMMKKHEEFRWMRLRIRRMADAWIQAIKSLAEKQNLEKRKRKKNVNMTLELVVAFGIMKKVVGNRSGCPTVGDRIVELIYIDIVGLAQFKKTLGPSWVHYQCMLRVLDSFGTEPEFNHANYAQLKGHKTPWGKWNLNPQQFYTMFPHTPDNSFLGFVVEQHLNSSDIHHINEIKRQNQSLVYGKVDSFWKKLSKESKLTAVEGSRNVDFWLFLGEECQVEVLFENERGEIMHIITKGHIHHHEVVGINVCGTGLSASERKFNKHSPYAVELKPGNSKQQWKQACEGPPGGGIPSVRGPALRTTDPLNKKLYLDIIHTYMEVHATVYGSSTKNIPSYVKNHGILSGRDLQFLLRETKLFVGLGFPYEGPAPLEAIANGCAFLNPKFSPPKSSKNTDFFIGKPTLRELTSQHPYAEVFIGQPHVWTVDLDNQEGVEDAVKAILSQKVISFIPFSPICDDFCHGQVMWPPLSALQVKLAEPGQSCKQVCQEKQLICEPSFFQHLNKDKDLLKYEVTCQSSEMAKDIVVPSFDPKSKHCVFQAESAFKIGTYLLQSIISSILPRSCGAFRLPPSPLHPMEVTWGRGGRVPGRQQDPVQLHPPAVAAADCVSPFAGTLPKMLIGRHPVLHPQQ
ncbi:hypothetical protein EI555_001115 [Monodon monoceros]|uniref:alpha-1,6-mannosyl-glycoprotein 6-beta-N-acetylglucosaminyltransferase n=2 Tax=Boreoeutheria TaxID=1437010 RepID=A0A4U1EI84_MONMO|nr:hypothetical protein EI555_001115 [Monodon monoceros]